MDTGELRGSIITRPSPIKVAHLTRTPYVSCAYWDSTHDVAIADCRVTWTTEPHEVQRVWDLFLQAPPPLGYDFANAYPDGPSSPDCHVLRLEPWRILVNDVGRMTSGRRAEVWTDVRPEDDH